MSSTHFSGPIKAGTIREGANANVGYAVMCQTGVVSWEASDLVNDLVFKLPAGAQILDMWASATVVYNSATSATLSFGTASGGTQYGGSMNAKTAVTLRPTMTAAIQAAMDDIGTNTTLVATVTSDGQPSEGSLNVFVTYIQK